MDELRFQRQCRRMADANTATAAVLPLLIAMTAWSAAVPAETVGASPTNRDPVWHCFTASDAKERRTSVERGMLPRVVFEGRSQPATLDGRMIQHKVPALAVAVIRQGRLDWSAAYGSLGSNFGLAGCDSLFQAGSLAKPVTLLAALRMRRAGLIDLDRDVDRYLRSWHLPPGHQTPSNPVTFRNLLSHTSGITPGGYRGYADGEAIPTDQQVANGTPPANSPKVEVLRPPGEELSYSGGGYTVVEIALQDLLRRPFEQILGEWVLTPVGLRQADFTQPLPAANHTRAARGHDGEGGAVRGGWHTHPEQAAAGLWATPSDMAVFLIELWKGYHGESRIFDQASVREMLANPVDGHAYGFRLIGDGDGTSITHYGGTVGYTAGMTMNLATGNGAVFMTNAEGGSNLGREFLQSVSRVYDWPMFRETRVTAVERPVEALQPLTGRYVFAEQDWQVSVVVEAGALTLVFPNGDRYGMVPISGGPMEFIHPDTAVRAGFDVERGEARIRLYGQVGTRETGSNR